MENENELPNDVPVESTNTEELQNTIIELVDTIKEQEKIQQEEQLKQEEQFLLDEQAKEEQNLIDQEQQIEKEKADAEFKEQVLQSLDVDAPTQIDYTAHLDSIIVSLDKIHEKQAQSDDANYIITLYGFIVIPAIFLIWSMWKMLKPFLP